MRTRLFIIAVGLLVAATLAVVLVRSRAAARAVAEERETLARSDRALGEQRTAFARRVVEVQGDLMDRKRAVLSTQSAADRARPHVGAWLARLKAEHAARPPVLRPPAPPQITGGGAFFPELMSDPEYNALYARSVRARLEMTRGRLLRELGVPEESIAKAIDVLADEEASLMDLQNLRRNGQVQPTATEYSKLIETLRSETNTQLQPILGETAYERYAAETNPVPASLRRGADRLARRLSYTAEPLTAAQQERLVSYDVERWQARPATRQEIQRMMDARKQGVVPVDEDRQAFLRSVLTPAQMAAVDELHRETEAGLKRTLLPQKKLPGTGP